MEKFLIFIDAADDAAMYPVSKIQSLTVASDATLLVKFAPGSLGEGQAASVDIVTITTTADKELVVFKALAEAITDIGAFNGEKFLVVCDDVNSVFAHPDILSCTIALDA
jgi:hypothetical protein